MCSQVSTGRSLASKATQIRMNTGRGDRGRQDVLAATAWAVQLCAMALDVDVVVAGGGMTRPPDAFLLELQDVPSARRGVTDVGRPGAR